MRRDFKDEYQNYIESDMPDLWSRIESNLSPRQSADEGQSQPEHVLEDNRKSQSGAASEENTKSTSEKRISVMRFFGTAVPVAAALCVLVIGVKVIRMQGNIKNETATAAETMGTDDAEYEETASEEAEAETTDDAEYGETAGEEAEAVMTDDAAYEENVGEEIKENDILGNSESDTWDMQNQANAAAEDAAKAAVEITRAVLSKISVASEEMQEKGYAYVYTFQLEDESTVLVYVTAEQIDSMAEEGLEIARKEAYSLVVYPIGETEKQENLKEEYVLQKIEKLP